LRLGCNCAVGGGAQGVPEGVECLDVAAEGRGAGGGATSDALGGDGRADGYGSERDSGHVRVVRLEVTVGATPRHGLWFSNKRSFEIRRRQLF